MAYFWISKNRSYGRDIKFGDKIPEKYLSEENVKNLLARGFISKDKPISFTDAKKKELETVKIACEKLKEENLVLIEENENLKAVIEKVPKNKKEAAEKIAELEKTIEDLTAPADDGGEENA